MPHPAADGRPTSIVVVDDEPAMLLLMSRLLAGLGHGAVTLCNSAIEALGVLERAPADLVISDLNMPGMDGAELARRVAERGHACRFIFMSGDEDATVLGAARSAEAHGLTVLGCLPKPPNVEALGRLLKHW
jgi:two-component system chemotaxis sensor kinase CheA